MDNICDKCGHDISESRLKDNNLLSTEDYVNVFGTRCLKCNALILPSNAPVFVTEYKNKLEVLRKEFRENFKKHFLNKKG